MPVRMPPLLTIVHHQFPNGLEVGRGLGVRSFKVVRLHNVVRLLHHLRYVHVCAQTLLNMELELAKIACLLLKNGSRDVLSGNNLVIEVIQPEELFSAIRGRPCSLQALKSCFPNGFNLFVDGVLGARKPPSFIFVGPAQGFVMRVI
mgnify:FL=1